MKRIKQILNTMWQHIYKMAKESPYDKFREGEIHGYLRALYENKLIAYEIYADMIARTEDMYHNFKRKRL